MANARSKRSASTSPSIVLQSASSVGIDVAQELRRRIAHHELPPGSKVKEVELASEFGVPRSRIREVLSTLEERGLVERIPNKGAVVTRLDLAQVVSIYEAREALEGMCVRLATLRSPKGHWDALHEYFENSMLDLLRAGNLDAFLAGYETFRTRVFAAAQNPVVQGMLDSILERTQMIIRRAIILPGRAERGLMQHRAVLQAMTQGDAEEAERLRRENLREAAEWVRRYHKYVI
jgi:DNA-binding GntR family transcriptional regulator